MVARWLAVLVLGFVAGAATVMFLDPGETRTRVLAPVNSAGAASAAGHDHGESSITYEELPRATKAEVDQVIEAYGTKYPTAADAAADANGRDAS